MQGGSSPGVAVAVSRSALHEFSKPVQNSIRLLLGLGVEGDAHLGVTVQHRSRVAKDPSQPKLRHVHLVPAELHDELRAGGFQIAPGAAGENITTRGIDLLALPRGARLYIGRDRSAKRLRAAERLPARPDGSGSGPRRAGQPGPQGRHHGRCGGDRRSPRRRPDPSRVAGGAAPAPGAGLNSARRSVGS